MSALMRWLQGFVLVAAMVASAGAHAHAASDAYLTLAAATARDGSTVVDVRFDIALRDLDFVLSLDGDGDGNLTWGEVRRRHAAIERLAYDALQVTGDGKACRLDHVRQQVADRADGSYAALFFRATCAGRPRGIMLDYRLFFAVDPSHRAIVVFRSSGEVATALLAPTQSRVVLRP